MDMGMDSTGWIGVIELKDFRIIIDEGHDDVNEVSKTTSAATGDGDAVDGSMPSHAHANDGSVVPNPYMHAHPMTAEEALYSLTANDDGSLNLTFTPDTGYVGGHVGDVVAANPSAFAASTHTHDFPDFADAGSMRAEDTTVGENDDGTDQTMIAAGTFTIPTDQCDTSCVEQAGGHQAYSGTATSSVNNVPAHQHLVELLDLDTEDTVFEKVMIHDTPIMPVAPIAHTHDTGHAHDGHTHEAHTHTAYAHSEHTHDSALVIKNPTITAKLINGPLSIKIFKAPENVAGLVDPVENDEDDDHLAESDDEDIHVDLGGAGITLGYDTEGLGIAVGISSELAYDEPEDNADTEEDESARKGDWYINGDINVDIGPATIDLQVVQTIKGDDSDPTVGPETGFAAKITGNLGDLSLSAGGDIVLTGATDTTAASTDYELGAGLGFALTDTTTMDADYIYSTDKDVASDVEVSLKDTAGIIENLSFALSWGLYDLSNGNPDNEDKGHNDKLDMMVGANLGYGFEALGGKLTPSIDVKYNRLDSDKAVVDTEVKLLLTEAIPQAELGMKWKSDSVFDPDDDSLGVLTAWTKVSY
jgi:opacity protein-like surface antigen